MFTFIKRKYINLISDTRFSEIFTGSVWAVCGRVIAVILNLAFSVMVARLYGADAIGIVAVINSFLMLATIFTVLGTKTSILRLIPEYLAKYSPTSAFKVYRKTQWMVIGISGITGAAFFLGSRIIAEKVFSKPYLSYYFALASIFLVFKSIMELNTSAVRGLRLIKLFALMQFLPQTCNLLFLITVGLFWHSQDIPVYAVLFGFTATGIIGWLAMENAFKKKMRMNDLLHQISRRKILSISFPMLMTSSMMFFIGETGIMILAAFHNETDVGYYFVAVKLANLTTFILNAVNSMVGPKFSELYQLNKMEELFYVAKKSAKLIFWTTIPVLLILVIFGEQCIRLAFGSEFVVAYPALVFLVIGQFINSISGATGFFMNMTGHQKIFRNIIFVAALINIVGNLWLTPLYGILGTGFATMSSIIVWNLSTLYFIKKKYNQIIGYLPYF